MKKEIKFAISEHQEDESIFLKYVQKFKNSLIIFEKDHFIFKSKFSFTSQEIIFVPTILKIDDLNLDFVNYLIQKIIPKALQQAKNMKVETFDPCDFVYRSDEKYDDVLINCIHFLSLIWKNQKWTFLELATEIFVKLLQNHCFINGNKRFAINFLIVFLDSMGYYFKWSKTLTNDQVKKKILEIDIAFFAYRLSNRSAEDLIAYAQSNESIFENVFSYENWEQICKNKILKHDQNLTITQRHESLKKEIFNWIKEHVLISYKS